MLNARNSCQKISCMSEFMRTEETRLRFSPTRQAFRQARTTVSLYLHIRPGFVCDFHDKFTAFSIGWVHQVIKNVKVHSGTQVIYIGYKNIFLPLSDQGIQQTRVIETGVDVSMARRIPALCVLSWVRHILGYRQQCFLVNSRIPGKTMGFVKFSPTSDKRKEKQNTTVKVQLHGLFPTPFEALLSRLVEVLRIERPIQIWTITEKLQNTISHSRT